MKPDLLSEYTLLKEGNKKANSFSKLIRNNRNLEEELYDRSADITNFYINPSDLQRLRFIFEDGKVLFCGCGNPRTWRNFRIGYNKTCGNKKCIARENNKSVSEFYQKNHGVDHLFQTNTFKSKLKETFISRYGVDNPGKNEDVKNKIRATNMERFGETSWLKVEENRERISRSIIRNNMKDRMYRIDKFNIPIEIENFNTKEVGIRCNMCGIFSTTSTSYFNKKIAAGQNPCLECNPPLYSESKVENELYDYLKDIYKFEIIVHDRKTCGGKEIDFFLPDLNIGFEFHGIWWHSEIFKGKNGNIDKKDIIEKKGIKIYHIWEDNWILKKEITKSRILNALCMSNRIYARKCKILMVDSREERKFLDDNHIQGYVPSKIKLGLYHKDELVSIMTFGSKRRSLGQRSKDGEYEMLRFCNKLETSVVGGASKLFKEFMKKYDPDLVISYQDNSWHTGNLYQNLGFSFVSKSKPNYYWCKKNVRFHRFNFRKDKLIRDGFDRNKTENVIMTERGYYKLWDFGNLKWEYKKA